MENLSGGDTKGSRVFIYPLNNLYYYNCFYTDATQNIDKFNEIILNSLKIQNRPNMCLDDFCINEENICKLDGKLKILPYTHQEFLVELKNKHIDIHLIYRTEKEKTLIKIVCDILKINDFIKSITYENEIKDGDIVISEILSELTKIKTEKQVFTIWNILITGKNAEYDKLQTKNLQRYRNISKEEHPDLIIESLRQANYFLEHIKDSSEIESIRKIKENFYKDALQILYFFDTYNSSKCHRKRQVCTSTKKIIFKPFIFRNLADLNNLKEITMYNQGFDNVLVRCPYWYFEKPDLALAIHSYLEEKFPKVLFIHNLNKIIKLFNRQESYHLIHKFSQELRQEILNKFSVDLNVPESFQFLIDENNSEECRKKLARKIKSYPVIIKADAAIEHEMIIILREEALQYFISDSNFETKKKIYKFICQIFIPHEGVLYKSGFLNHKTMTVLRSSLPVFSQEIISLPYFKDGYLNFDSEFLSNKKTAFTEEVKIGNRTDSSENIKLYNRNDDLFAYICEKFNSLAGITLFNIDFIFNKENNSYYIIEINYFPSFRNIKIDLIEEFQEHILNLNRNYKINS
jgi:hypothetical protein